jgi:hypothetical protein
MTSKSVRLAVVVDDFDVVAVGVEYVRGVVAVVVAGPLTRFAVAAVSGRSRVRVEPAYVVVFAREGDVMFCVGSPAITRKEPSDAPTENVRSVVRRCSPAGKPQSPTSASSSEIRRR